MGWKNGQFMSNIERGLCSIPSKYLMKFCAVLNVPVEHVIDAMVEDYKSQLWSEASTQVLSSTEAGTLAHKFIEKGFGFNLDSEAV